MCVDTHALGAGEGILFPFFLNGTKSPGFLIWVLTRILGAQTQIKMWPEPGSGPWLVWEDDSELKKPLIPSVSGGPLRKHSPPGTVSESPLHSFTSFKEQMPICTFYSQPQFRCRSIFSRTFRKVFWRDIILRASFIYDQRNPIPQLRTKSSFLNHVFVKWHSNPNLYPPQRRKRLSFGGLQHIWVHVPRWTAWAKPCPLISLMAVSDKHLPTQQAHSTADHLLWLETEICLAIGGSLHWSQGCLCRPSHQFPHFLSVVLNIYPENQQHFSLLTNLKGQKSTQDSSQNTNISRRAFDITDPGRNYYMLILPHK